MSLSEKPSLVPLSCLLLFLVVCSCGVPQQLPRKVKLPVVLEEASGLAFRADRSVATLHNDSGDGPFLYQISPKTGQVLQRINLPTRAQDWEDICLDDEENIYVGDFGNNRGERTGHTIYRYSSQTEKTDSIVFTYPGQDGRGRAFKGNYDCEAMVFYQNHLHLFTKALPGVQGQYWTYHFRIPATAGTYEATIVDSLYLPRRVITGASLDAKNGELLLVGYNYKKWLGFFPVVASSLFSLRNFSDDRFFTGQLKRRNVSWGLPIQYESIDYYNDQFLYLATEKVKGRKRAFLKRKKRWKLD
ncbi:MAG: hypothetical protein AAF828_02455 [Bacteroidota bacterium]